MRLVLPRCTGHSTFVTMHVMGDIVMLKWPLNPLDAMIL